MDDVLRTVRRIITVVALAAAVAWFLDDDEGAARRARWAQRLRSLTGSHDSPPSGPDRISSWDERLEAASGQRLHLAPETSH